MKEDARLLVLESHIDTLNKDSESVKKDVAEIKKEIVIMKCDMAIVKTKISNLSWMKWLMIMSFLGIVGIGIRVATAV